jgi:apolipoprotein N-acyltransferase
MFTGTQIRIRLMGLAAGLLLAAGNFDGRLAPLQIVALAGLAVFASGGRTTKSMLLTGFYMGLGYTLPQMAMLRLPAPITAILMADLVGVMILLSLAAGLSLRRPTVLSAVVFAAAVTILDWANYTLLPMWGTAQSLGRCWSQWPRYIGFVSYTGIGGIVFVLAAVSAWIGLAIAHPPIRWRVLCATIAVLSLVTIVSLYGPSPSTDTLRVAAVGYDSRQLPSQVCLEEQQVLDQRVVDPISRAAEQGARLIVFPELAFEFAQSNREQSIQQLCDAARRFNIAIVVGYFDSTENENRALLIPPSGKRPLSYTKTYLTPFEPFQKGTGRLQRIRVDGIWIGAMICQDDNFTVLSRAYSRLGVGVVAVPTLDWKPVRYPHLQNSIHRSIESDYAVVRAAVDGVSAIISPQGIVLGRIDHLRTDQTLLVADVPCGRGLTLYARFGDWVVWLSMAIVAVRLVRFCRFCPDGLCLLCPVYLRSRLDPLVGNLKDRDIR